MSLTQTEKDALKAVPQLVTELARLNGILESLIEQQIQREAATKVQRAATLEQLTSIATALESLPTLVEVVQGLGDFSKYNDGIREDERERRRRKDEIMEQVEDPLKYPEDLPRHPTKPGPHPIDPEYRDNIIKWPDGNVA